MQYESHYYDDIEGMEEELLGGTRAKPKTGRPVRSIMYYMKVGDGDGRYRACYLLPGLRGLRLPDSSAAAAQVKDPAGGRSNVNINIAIQCQEVLTSAN